MSRRTLLKGGSASVAGLSVLSVAGPAQAFPGDRRDVVIPWLDQPAPNPVPEIVRRQLVWEELDSRLTPTDEFFIVSHYGEPAIDPAAWRLGITGLVARPESLSLADVRARRRREVEFTMECSGNTGPPFLIGAVGNARWGGTPLAPLLRQAGVLGQATEVVFWGADRGEVTFRDNPGQGGVPLTFIDQFARSMSLEEALSEDNILCYEMNGESLPPAHGAPVRLIAPGWYGVANVKWLTRIEVIDRRFAGRFMSRDYVTIREEQRDGQTVWTFTTVGRDRLKSAPAKVVGRGNRYLVMGAAWGAPIDRVEVRVDDGPWQEARLRGRGHDGHRRGSDFAWVFWTLPLGRLPPGEHTVTSRATDVDGNVQPAPDDPLLAAKRTFWESNGHITRRVLIPAPA